jgi:photosystem II stability/assembly factor-like uncharacterized protein
MKRSLTLVVILFLTSKLVLSQWTQQISGISTHLNDVYFLNADTGFAVGDNGVILKTSDGGNDWIQKSSGTTLSVYDVFFVNETIGYASGHTFFLKTTDGGNNWTLFPSTKALYSVWFVSEMVGYVVGTPDNYNGVICKTNDGGITFTDYSTFFDIPLTRIQFLNDSVGFAYGFEMITGSGPGNQYPHVEILKTIDRGLTWLKVFDETYFWGLNIFFTDENTCFLPSTGGMYKMVYNGTSWVEFSFPAAFTTLRSCHFPNDSTGHMVGDNGKIYSSIDCGQTYTEQYSNTTNWLNSVFFITSDIGYVVGRNGTILKTINGTTINDIQSNNSIMISFFPNPVIDKFTIDINDFANLEIINIQGQIVYTKSLTEKSNILDISNLRSGVYTLRIKTDRGIAIRKLIKQ